MLATADLVQGKTIGIDATTLEATAALRSIVRRDSGETYQECLTRLAQASGIARRITAHSGRIGLASELTRRGASTTDVMMAGNWRTASMVAHYSAGATAEHGAVARYL